MKVLVLGGGGFVGRHVALALLTRRHEVTCASRNPARAARRASGTPFARVHVRFERMQNSASWYPVILGFDAVVNCVGILRPRFGESYDKVHRQAPAALAAACAIAGPRRLVHVSALGLAPDSHSRFLLSKLAAEREICASRLDYSIVRPSLLDGEGGFGAQWLRRVARWPVHAVPGDARGLIAPLSVDDLAEAIALLCEKRNCTELREVELGGPEQRTIAEHLAALRRAHGRPIAYCIRVPALVARVVSHCCDLLHFSPYSYGHHELMRRDNLPSPNRLRQLLGREPRRVGLTESRIPSQATLPTVI